MTCASPNDSLPDDERDFSLRNIALKAGACECNVFFTEERVTFAVQLRHGVTLAQVAAAVGAQIPVRDKREYVFRDVDTGRTETHVRA